MSTIALNETEARKIEKDISLELDIQCTCLGSKHIAGFLIEENLLNKFLDETNYPLPRDISSSRYDYREMALHSYTLISKDAVSMKDGIYDDSILFVLSSEDLPISEDQLIAKVVSFLALPENKQNAYVLSSHCLNYISGKESIYAGKIHGA